MEVTRENASEILIRFITEENITQVEVARKSGLTENTISSLVNGGKPQAITANRLKIYFKSIGYNVEKK